MKILIGLVFYSVIDLAVGKYNDSTCHSLEGVCQNIENECTGRFLRGYCPGPASRRCCITNFSLDVKCRLWGGKCQTTTDDCGGLYVSGRCKGPSTRKCCAPLHLLDSRCIDFHGSCINKFRDKCDGDYWMGLCYGGASRQCCVPDVTKLVIDKLCAKEGGVCQLNDVPCAGHYVKGKCGGPFNRKCCIKAKEKNLRCQDVMGVCQFEDRPCNGNYVDGHCAHFPGTKCCSQMGDSGDVGLLPEERDDENEVDYSYIKRMLGTSYRVPRIEEYEEDATEEENSEPDTVTDAGRHESTTPFPEITDPDDTFNTTDNSTDEALSEKDLEQGFEILSYLKKFME